MDQKDWMLLKILSEEKNITKTAERLFISQPALTYRLKQIENDFGTELVTRNRKGIEFTTEGEYIVEYAKKMLLQLRDIKDNVLNLKNKIKGNLRLGVTSNFAHYKLPKILREFLENFPEVHVNVETGWSSSIISSLQKDDVQIGIVRGNYAWKEDKILIDEEPLCLIAPNNIALTDLPSTPRIYYKTDYSLRQTMDTWWDENYSKPPMVTMVVDKIETCIEMVKNGLGYSVVPYLSLKSSDDIYVEEIKNQDSTLVVRQTWLFYRRSSLNLSVVRAFIEFINEGTSLTES